MITCFQKRIYEFGDLLKIIQLIFFKFSRYHYDGIAIKKESSFYARFCCLLYEQNYLRFVFKNVLIKKCLMAVYMFSVYENL